MDPPNQDDAASHPEPPQASPGGAALLLSPTRIPKKHQPAVEPSASTESKLPSPPLSETRSNSFDDSGSLVLPEGITLPPSVTPQMIDGRLRRNFLDLAPSQMREVLTEYDEALKEKGSEIRNKNAYLFGVVKRYKALSNGGQNAPPQGHNVSPQVLVSLIASSHVNVIDSIVPD